MEPQPDRLADKGREIVVLLPIDLLKRLVRGDQTTVLSGKRLDGFTVFIQNFDRQLAIGAINVHEQVLSPEGHRSRRKRSDLFTCIHGGEPVTSQKG